MDLTSPTLMPICWEC